jgi:L-lactate dehydrogenase complex protein LldF
MQKLAQLAQVPLVRDGFIEQLPGPLAGWSTMRDMPALPGETFREWWRKNRS